MNVVVFSLLQVRTATREEKKKLAMAMRAKQLKSIGRLIQITALDIQIQNVGPICNRIQGYVINF